MSDTIHWLVERYGLIAVFLGCTAEGESAAILAGFLAHQRVFHAWQAYGATLLGAFTGDALLFLAGRRFAGIPWVEHQRHKPGFERALQLVRDHPSAFVFLNRYAYGFRLAGGVAAGLSGIPVPRFLALNLASAALWAALFCVIGYVFGVGAERVIGTALAKHERLLIGLAIAAVATLIGWGVARSLSRRAARNRA